LLVVIYNYTTMHGYMKVNLKFSLLTPPRRICDWSYSWTGSTWSVSGPGRFTPEGRKP